MPIKLSLRKIEFLFKINLSKNTFTRQITVPFIIIANISISGNINNHFFKDLGIIFFNNGEDENKFILPAL